MGGLCAVCGVPVAGADVMYAPDGRMVCTRCFAKIDAASTVPLRPAWRGYALGGAIVGAIPFFIHFSTSSSSSVNGKVTSFVYRDYIALAGGVVAALLAIATIVSGRKEQQRRMLAILAGAGVLALGGYQSANGLGLFATPGSADVSEAVSFDTVQMKAALPPAPPAVNPNDPATCADMEACFQLGLKLDDKHDPRAAAAYERSCEKGGPGGCLNAGTGYLKADAAKGVALYKKGCDLNAAESCTQYARGLRDGNGIEKNTDQAKSLFDKSCTAGYMLACSDLAKMYDLGQGLKADRGKALELFEKICDHDDGPDNASECALAGTALHDAKTTKAQAKLGASYLGKACTRGDKYCYFFAMANETGWGVAKDLKKARELYGKACNAAHPDACNNLGTMQELGKGGKKDRPGAKLSYKAACELKVAAGCKNQKRLK